MRQPARQGLHDGRLSNTAGHRPNLRTQSMPPTMLADGYSGLLTDLSPDQIGCARVQSSNQLAHGETEAR